MFETYILKSLKSRKHYVGHTENMEKRIVRHNSGMVKSTKSGRPWEVLYIERFSTKSEAYRRELEIKSYKGGIKFKKLLGIF